MFDCTQDHIVILVFGGAMLALGIWFLSGADWPMRHFGPWRAKINRQAKALAYANIKQFVIDCEMQAHCIGIQCKRLPKYDTPRYNSFGFRLTLRKVSVTIEMPGLPLEIVRYIGGEQNLINYRRFYVNGSLWAWKFAVELLQEDWKTNK